VHPMMSHHIPINKCRRGLNKGKTKPSGTHESPAIQMKNEVSENTDSFPGRLSGSRLDES